MRAAVRVQRSVLAFVVAVVLILGLLLTGGSPSGSASTTTAATPTMILGAARVDGHQVRIKLKGQRYGKKARITLNGYRGMAKEVMRTVRVKRTKTVKRLKPGRYKVTAKRITSNGGVAKAKKIKPKRVTVTQSRGATTRISYRQIKESTTPAATANPTVRGVTRAELGNSWRPGCPVEQRQLRAIDINFVHYSGKIKRGRIIVARKAVRTTRAALVAAFRSGFRIKSIIPIQAFGSSDDKSMRADNTSGLRCVIAERSGGRYWSAHAQGLAVDINPRRNPDVFPDKVVPENGARYATRWPVRRGMLTSHSSISKVFRRAGWTWGGNWRSHQDYQHYSLTGN
jgi:hypothetical protein